MENNSEKSLAELLDSINSSIEDIRKHPTDTTKLPSNFEILVRGVASNKAIDAIFSPKMDNIIDVLVKHIESGDLEKILQNRDMIEKLSTSIFGDKAFKGPVSNAVLNSIQSSMSSIKYNTMKSIFGRTGIALKKYRLVINNLEKDKEKLKASPEELKKYDDAVYAIKRTVKFIAKIYRSRKIVNRKVFDGLSNVVYESSMADFNEYDECL